MKYINNFLQKGSKKREGFPLYKKVLAIVLHYTATAGAGAKRIRKHWGNTQYDIYASAQVAVGDKFAVQMMPYDEVAYHVGSGTVSPQNAPHKYTEYGMRLMGVVKADDEYCNMLQEEYGVPRAMITPNFCTLGVEMCQERKKEGSIEISEKTVLNTIKIVRDLMDAYGVDVSNVVTHTDIVGWKSCPAKAIQGGGYGVLSAEAQREIRHTEWWNEIIRELS